ncbi:hypothetical protein ACTFIV_003838 [Dictyostelium citrinum]
MIRGIKLIIQSLLFNSCSLMDLSRQEFGAQNVTMEMLPCFIGSTDFIETYGLILEKAYAVFNQSTLKHKLQSRNSKYSNLKTSGEGVNYKLQTLSTTFKYHNYWRRKEFGGTLSTASKDISESLSNGDLDMEGCFLIGKGDESIPHHNNNNNKSILNGIPVATAFIIGFTIFSNPSSSIINSGISTNSNINNLNIESLILGKGLLSFSRNLLKFTNIMNLKC